MFSRHGVFVSCQRHVCSLCVNVTPSVRMSVAWMAGENWLRRNEKQTFFFSLIGIFWYDFRGGHSVCSQLMQQRLFHTMYTSVLLHFPLKMFPHNKRWNWREVSVTNTNPTEKPSVSLRLNFADFAAESSGQFLRLSIDSKFKFSLLVLRVKMGHILAHSHLYDLSCKAERTGGRRTSSKQQ